MVFKYNLYYLHLSLLLILLLRRGTLGFEELLSIGDEQVINIGSILNVGQTLNSWQIMKSDEDNYFLQLDSQKCSVQLFKTFGGFQNLVWSSSPSRSLIPEDINNCYLKLTKEANLGIWGALDQPAIWESNTGSMFQIACHLKLWSLFGRGGLKIYCGNGWTQIPIWAEPRVA